MLGTNNIQNVLNVNKVKFRKPFFKFETVALEYEIAILSLKRAVILELLHARNNSVSKSKCFEHYQSNLFQMYNSCFALVNHF